MLLVRPLLIVIQELPDSIEDICAKENVFRPIVQDADSLTAPQSVSFLVSDRNDVFHTKIIAHRAVRCQFAHVVPDRSSASELLHPPPRRDGPDDLDAIITDADQLIEQVHDNAAVVGQDADPLADLGPLAAA